MIDPLVHLGARSLRDVLNLLGRASR
jgi:hypothetical protein